MRGSRSTRSTVAILVGFVTVLVLGMTGVATASWVASTGTAGSVSAATTSVAVDGTAALTYTYQFAGAASTSPVIVKPLVVTNTGTAPLVYTLGVSNVSASGFGSSVALSLWLQVAGACGTTVAPGATTGTLAAPPTLPAGTATGAAGTSFTLCAATSLSTTVAATTGFSVTSTLSINGRVGTSNWVAAGSGSLTQSALTFCTQSAVLLGLLGYPVSLNLATPVGAGPFTYRTVLDATPTTVVKIAQSSSTIVVQYADIATYTSPLTLRVQASSDGFATVASSVVQKVTFQAGVSGVVLPSVTCVAA